MTYMNPRDAGVLVRLMANDQPSTPLEIGRDSGMYPNGNSVTWAQLGLTLISSLVRSGAATKCGRNPLKFQITEKGRIAVALFRAIANRKDKASSTHHQTRGE